MKYNIEYNKDTLILITGIISYIILIIELLKENYKIVFFYFLLFGLFFLVFHNFAFILAFLFLLIIIIFNYLTIKEYNSYRTVSTAATTATEDIGDDVDEEEENDNQCEIDITRRVVKEVDAEPNTIKQTSASEDLRKELLPALNAVLQQNPGGWVDTSFSS